MKKNCLYCKRANKPTRNSACNHKVRYPLIDIVQFKYNDDGSSYCDDYRQVRRGKK